MAGDARVYEVGLSLLRATLESHRYEKLDELLVKLVADLDVPARQPVARLVLEHLEAQQGASPDQELQTLFDSLDRLPGDMFDPVFHEAVERARQRLAPSTASAPAEGD